MKKGGRVQGCCFRVLSTDFKSETGEEFHKRFRDQRKVDVNFKGLYLILILILPSGVLFAVCKAKTAFGKADILLPYVTTKLHYLKAGSYFLCHQV